MRVRDMTSIASSVSTTRTCVDAIFAAWSNDVDGGDSHGPALIPINGKLVLLGVQLDRVTTDGLPVSILDSVLVTLGGGYTSTKVDLSSFTYFP